MVTEAKQLLQKAAEAAKNAYTPYSNDPKGAALETADGSIYTGTSVECASYGGTLCAEVAALAAAVADGKRHLLRLAVSQSFWPCGHCRQFYRDFGVGLTVIRQAANGEIEQKSLEELLPMSFGPEHLG